ncbi:hypothetical protein EHS25_000519 [Saitozyma podzolica]|uniref:Uncharacterized protein n=1 Tax=Saitozyma podzolica TaxID=1890683 RepID=A0A427YWH5_9TREE|nr:hypothetical protein EHS25_000519 [Saitozyma podzolica]
MPAAQSHPTIPANQANHSTHRPTLDSPTKPEGSMDFSSPRPAEDSGSSSSVRSKAHVDLTRIPRPRSSLKGGQRDTACGARILERATRRPTPSGRPTTSEDCWLLNAPTCRRLDFVSSVPLEGKVGLRGLCVFLHPQSKSQSYERERTNTARARILEGGLRNAKTP